MAIGTNNLVVAMDPTIDSLKLGKNFTEKNNINNVIFFNADIFDNPIVDGFFDCVWCSGVLHHTKNSKRGFEIISRWVKNDGLLIIGVYNTLGRFEQIYDNNYKVLGKSRIARKNFNNGSIS